MIKEAERIISCFVSGMSAYRDHPGDSRSVAKSAEEAIDAIKAMRTEHFFTIAVNDDGILISGLRMSLDAPDVRKFFIKLRQKRVVTLVISNGVQVTEVRRLIADLASSGDFFHCYAHIAVRRGDALPRSDRFLPGRGPKNDLFQIRRIYQDVSVRGRIDMTVIDEILGSMIAAIRREGRLPTFGHTDGYDLCVHSENVAIHSIFQGEHLGLGNALLYDIGVSALLHDIGKTLLPQALLDKRAPLTESEWTMMKKHTQYGAALLASLSGVPEIAVIVAYEHHKKYDGTGYPVTGRVSRKQHIISQIVAISDFYCAMSDRLPRPNAAGNTSILGLLAETSKTLFNPMLVNNFVRIMKGFPNVNKHYAL